MEPTWLYCDSLLCCLEHLNETLNLPDWLLLLMPLLNVSVCKSGMFFPLYQQCANKLSKVIF